jgi:hypothetical protein
MSSSTQRQNRIFKIGLTSITITGMTLSYYRTPFFFAAFILLIGLGLLLQKRIAWNLWRKSTILDLFGITFLSGFLFFPLVVNRLMGSRLSKSVVTGITRGITENRLSNEIDAWRTVTEYWSVPLIILVIISLLFGIYKKKWGVVLLNLWAVVLMAYLYGGLIHLPGSKTLQSFAIMIALYLPFSLVIGWFMGEISLYIHSKQQLISGILIVLVAGYGGIKQRNIVDPATHAMITRPDLIAMDWIENHTDSNARFLVQGFRIYNGTSAVGADAGWWIPLLAHRSNTMPPQYAMVNEVPQPSNYSKNIVDLIAQLENSRLDSQGSLTQLCSEGITHIYTGQGQGLVSYGWPQLFNPVDLAVSDSFSPIYRQDRISIYAMKSEICD